MNELLDICQSAVHIFQKDFEWYVQIGNRTIPYTNNMVLELDDNLRVTKVLNAPVLYEFELDKVN